jgi:lysophospholipase L1-like esterase
MLVQVLLAVLAAVVLVVALTALALVRTFRGLPRPARNSPAAVAAARSAGTGPARPAVVVLGASTVRGNVSYPIVKALGRRLPGYQLVNGGLNGTTARQATDRVPDVAACAPDAVIVMVGGNDLLAITDNPLARLNINLAGTEERPTYADYATDLATLVARLADSTDARIALCSLPIAGERLDSDTNVAVDRMNEVIRSVAHRTGVAFLPVDRHVKELLLKVRGRVGKDVPRHPGVILGAAVLRLGLGLPLGWIARVNGYTLLSDGIHLTGRAGEVVAGVMAEFVGGATP